MRLQVREVYWLLAIIPILLGSRYLPALAILGLASVSTGSVEHRTQAAAMYVAWGATGIAGIGLSWVALLGPFHLKMIQVTVPLVIVGLSAFTQFALMAWAFGTYGRFERDTYGPIIFVPDLGVLTACLVFAVLIAPPPARFVVGLAGLIASVLTLGASTAALFSAPGPAIRVVVGILIGVLVLGSVAIAVTLLSRQQDFRP